MLLLIDFESTGIDTKTARITEIGAMVVDDSFTPTGAQLSQLVWESGYPAITAEVERVTGITQEMLLAEGVTPLVAWGRLGELVTPEVTHVVAYNRAYDENLYREEMARGAFTMLPAMNIMAQLPWVCAMSDLESNHAFKSWRLMHVALEYGVAVNPKELHRAINDVELMRQMLVASGTTVAQLMEFQTSPWVYVVAKTKPPWEDGGKSTAACKELGFAWQQARGDDSGRIFEKRWVKRLKEKDLDALREKASFEIARV